MLRYWLCFASAVCLAGHCGANYCRDANLCCPGRDSSCVIQKAHQNAIIEDLTDKPCYCDHACLKLGDCCPDFRETCGGKFFIIYHGKGVILCILGRYLFFFLAKNY